MQIPLICERQKNKFFKRLAMAIIEPKKVEEHERNYGERK